MEFKHLTNKEDFDAALATPNKFVFIYVYENEIDEHTEKRFHGFFEKFGAVAEPFVVDVVATPRAKETLQIEKVPTIILFKDEKEVKRVEEPNREKMMEIGALLNGEA